MAGAVVRVFIIITPQIIGNGTETMLFVFSYITVVLAFYLYIHLR